MFTSAPRTPRWLVCILSVGVLACGICSKGRAQDDTSSGNADSREASIAQMKRMQQRAASLKAWTGTGDTKEVEIVASALLRYSSPGGETATADGSVWAWGKDGRPVALAAIFFERLPKGDEKWSCELLSLSNEPLGVQARPGWKWTPARSGIRFLPVPDAPAVAENEAGRSREMKELARRFSATETFDEGKTDQLRLMIRALHRYANPEKGLIDGAIYAFAGGTNPEALLLLEARADSKGRAAWYFGFARMGAASCQAKLDDQVVWECLAIDGWDNRQPYYSMFGTDATVFGGVAE